MKQHHMEVLLRASSFIALMVVALGFLWLVELVTHASQVAKLESGPKVVAALEAICLGTLVSYVLYIKAQTFRSSAIGAKDADKHESVFRVLVLIVVFTICSGLVYALVYLGDRWLALASSAA